MYLARYNRSLDPWSSGDQQLPRPIRKQARRDAAIGIARGHVAAGYIQGALYAGCAAANAQPILGMIEQSAAQYMPIAAVRVSAIANATATVMVDVLNRLAQ
jgi:hypothetical protein